MVIIGKNSNIINEALPFILRPHHSLCMQFFIGKGYSEQFTDNMYKVLALPDDTPVTITFGIDALCRCCPNLKSDKCETENKVVAIDKRVADICRFSCGDSLLMGDFLNKAKKDIILAGKLEEVCRDCEFTDICKPQAIRIIADSRVNENE